LGEDSTNAEVSFAGISANCKKSDLPPALDGGWGWMCVFGCWFMHFLLGGFGRSFGVVYVEMLNRFECSATTGSTLGGLFTAVRMGAGK